MASKICGIVGYPLHRTLSPAMHEAAFKAVGLDWAYGVFPVPPGEAARAVDAMRILALQGLSVTVPHKVDVVPLVDELAPMAAAAGAVNTLRWSGERSKLVGENTDVVGVEKAIEHILGKGLEGERLLVLGAGGAARAACLAGLKAGCELVVVAARRPSAALGLVESMIEAVADGRVPMPKRADAANKADYKTSFQAISMSKRDLTKTSGDVTVVVNATPVGSDGTSSPLPAEALHGGLAVLDMIYYPSPTPLLELAKRLGAKAEDGLEMLLAQGAAQFEMWTGLEAPIDTMREACLATRNRWLQNRGSGAENP